MKLDAIRFLIHYGGMKILYFCTIILFIFSFIDDFKHFGVSQAHDPIIRISIFIILPQLLVHITQPGHVDIILGSFFPLKPGV